MARDRCSISGETSNETVTEEGRTRTGSFPVLPAQDPSTPPPKQVATAPACAAEPAVWDLTFPRCSIKGCIFPAASAHGTLCLFHELAEKEPMHFLSVQPSTMCLDRAKYGIAETEYDNSRARDRRALALQLARFRNEVA